MNGRVYSPESGRFLSPDPLIQAPTYSQSFNRYSYVWNNPLNNIDPSGFAAASAHNCKVAKMSCGGGKKTQGKKGSKGEKKVMIKVPEGTMMEAANQQSMINPVLASPVETAGEGNSDTSLSNLLPDAGKDGAGPSTDTTNPNSHQYTIGPTALCNTSSSGCNVNTALNVVNGASVPGETLPQEGSLTLMGNNPITHVVDQANLTVWNITQPGHTFHPGTVAHQLTVQSGTIFLTTTGVGTGNNPGFNNWVGGVLFRPTHRVSRRAMQLISGEYDGE